MLAPLLVGIDVGTTAVKGALFGLDGRVERHRRIGYPTERPAPGRVEQDPAHWIAAVDELLGEFASNSREGQIRAIGLTSQVNTHVFIDEAGRPLAPAIVWQDARAAEPARELDGTITDRERLDWWGAPIGIDASHALARAAWMQREAPDIWQRTAHILLPKDHLLQYLTGRLISDPMSNIGLVGADGCFIAPLLDRVDGVAERLPTLADMTEQAGVMRSDHPLAGVPVAVGTMDAWAGLLGTACVTDGDAMWLGGTSEILGIVSADRVAEPGVLVMPEKHGIQLHVGPTQSGGSSVAWFADLQRQSIEAVSELAAVHTATDPCPLFLPHLAGERAPLWDANSRGAFVGLDHGSGEAAMARAVLEGVAFSARWLFDSLKRSSDREPQLVYAGGGSFSSEPWNRLRADTLGLPIARRRVIDVGPLGAAGIASVAAAQHDSLKSAFADLVHTERVWEPDAGRASRQTERFDLYQRLYEQLREISPALAAGA